MDVRPKEGLSREGEHMHYSVGAVIRRNDDHYLLIEGTKLPLGWAGPAGHIDVGELPHTALGREVWEETGLEVCSSQRIFTTDYSME